MTRNWFLALLALPTWLGAAEGFETLRPFEGRTITRIEVAGNRITREQVILRELHSHVGQSLRLQQVQTDIQRLDNLDIFSSAKVVPVADGDGVALTIEVRELPFAVPYITYDVTDQDGWSFGPALKSVNMLGRDLYVAGFALFGGKTSFLLDLNYPWIAGNHFSLDLTLARIERENELDGFRETTFEISPWFGMYLRERGRVKFGGSYFRAQSDVPGHTLSKDGSDQLFQIGAGAGYDSRDVWGNPHEGWFNEIEAVKTGGVLGGDGDFWTAHLDVRRFQPAGATHTLVLASLLSLQSGAVGRSIPEYLDFHLGGANSIRGYQLEELGRDLYGKNQWIGTAEYRFPLMASKEYSLLGLRADLGLAGALFADAGLAWSRDREFTLARARMGYGLGLRLLMPAVDMARFDVGFDKAGNWRLYLAVFSKLEAQRFRLR
ncbi:MAG: BamA/TamA family outer membrane protein [Candidatus Latescibacteria bacterium]|nr:BamA/TamA family outer membrane protein [Candidatus Latescibacterota bacterium]